ncbi:MAG: Flp pilus assembly protein CpaB [bacterium]|nr:Flp pilus assembly protein CpaB [bacterium]
MKGKAIIPLALGLVVGLVALKLGVDAVQSAQGDQTSAPEINVVVATVDISPYVAVTADALVVRKTVQTPLLPPEAFGKLEDVVGRVTSKAVPAGTPISPAVLSPEGTGIGVIGKIEEGFRAVTVKTDEVTGVAYQLQPESFVDVLVVMDVRRGRKKETMSRVILQNVQVAAVGQVVSDAGEEGKGGGKRAKSVTLLIAAEDVPKLHLAQTKGKITLAMRGGEDEVLTTESNALESELLGVPREEQPQIEVASASSGPTTALTESMFAEGPPVHPPFTTTVINGPLGASSAGQILRVTYANSESMEVVKVGKGRTTGDGTSMQFGVAESGGAANTRNLFADRDRTMRRRGARTTADEPNDQDETFKETAE